MSIKIITDSCCDLPESLCDFYDIGVIPLSVELDGKSYMDRLEICPKELMAVMRQGKLPKTSQISVGAFMEFFTNEIEAGNTPLYISFSSELSGTYQSALMAKEALKKHFKEASIYVVDSKSATLGQGIIVLQAAKMVKEGRPLTSILEKLEEDAEHTQHYFMVEDINHLYRGGRLNKTSAVIGQLLNIKPILALENGKIVHLDNVRGQNRAIRKLKTLIGASLNNNEKSTIGITHGDNYEVALALRDYCQKEFKDKEIIINDVGATIGSHIGPGYIGIFY